ncbi:MAG: ribonuclease PH, partial [Pseudomonadota bacterium]
MFDDGLRRDGRSHDAMRPVCFEVGVNRHSEGSCRVSFGLTQLLICATVEHRVPSFLRGQGRGWLSSEYAMMVRATPDRNDRRRQLDDGRSREIARLIGRSLRSIVDFAALGERQIKIDCDVIDADAGTRTAAISGGYVALAQACRKLVDDGVITGWPLQDSVSAVSVVLHRGRALVDPDYREDSRADVD